MKTRESRQYTPYSFIVMKSKNQEILERQGCVFKGQELLTNHELDTNKPCYCGRPNKTKEAKR